MKRKEIAVLIFKELKRNEKALKEQYAKTKKQIAFFLFRQPIAREFGKRNSY